MKTRSSKLQTLKRQTRGTETGGEPLFQLCTRSQSYHKLQEGRSLQLQQVRRDGFPWSESPSPLPKLPPHGVPAALEPPESCHLIGCGDTTTQLFHSEPASICTDSKVCSVSGQSGMELGLSLYLGHSCIHTVVGNQTVSQD